MPPSQLLSALVRKLLLATRLALLPVRIRRGIAKGARWSLYPWSAYWRGLHEPSAQDFLEHLWDWKGKHIWDLGAHYGLYTVGLARLAGKEGSLASFEPNPVAFARLQLHVRRNRLEQVRLFPLAVSDRRSEEKFLSYGSFESTTAHLLYERETWDQSIPTITVQTCCLDELVTESQLRDPDFIKMDVEGHGHHALAGASATLRRARPVIFAAIHSREEVEGIISVLRPLGYAWQRIDGGPLDRLEDISFGDLLFVPESNPGLGRPRNPLLSRL